MSPDYERWCGRSVCQEFSESSGEVHDAQSAQGQKRKKSERGQTAVEMGQQVSQELEKWCPANWKDAREMPMFEEVFADLYWNEIWYNQTVKRAWAHVMRKWNHKSFLEIIDHRWANPGSFILGHVPYYTPYYSSLLLGRLLLQQCHDIPSSQLLIETVKRVIDKTEMKKNTLAIIGPPSCGKTFFCNTFLTLLWNVGQIQNPSKNGSTFTYQDAYGSRAALWNECIIEGRVHVENSKSILEGMPTSINVKHESQMILQRTPIIITANHHPWAHCPENKVALLDRMFCFNWTRQPWLAQCALYPCPLGIKLLMDNVDNIDWWNALPDIEFFADKDNVDVNNKFETWLQTQIPVQEYRFITNMIIN